MRNNKGGGESSDPSLFGDSGFYAPNIAYKNFSRIRGGAPDDQSVSHHIRTLNNTFRIYIYPKDITCRGLRAGNPQRIMHGHNKPTSGLISISCIRSGAFLLQGTVDLAKGERFVKELNVVKYMNLPNMSIIDSSISTLHSSMSYEIYSIEMSSVLLYLMTSHASTIFIFVHESNTQIGHFSQEMS